VNQPHVDAIARYTAHEILRRHAPDCLNRPGLSEAIARLARLGLEAHVRLYQAEQRPADE
jgi:hypothetical protein